MKLPHVRFTVMGMMILVAIVGVGLECVDLYSRRVRYRMLASWYEHRIWKRSVHRQFATEAMRAGRYDQDMLKSVIEEDTRASEYLGRLRRKYRVAASRPWMSIEPEPPEPEWLWQSEAWHH